MTQKLIRKVNYKISGTPWFGEGIVIGYWGVRRKFLWKKRNEPYHIKHRKNNRWVTEYEVLEGNHIRFVDKRFVVRA